MKNKAKEIAEAIDETPKDKVVNEEVDQEEVREEEDGDNEYQFSDKIVNGVHYPNGWEDLEENAIFLKMDEVFEEYKQADGDDDEEDAIMERNGFENGSHYEEFKNAMLLDRANREGVSVTQAGVNQYTEQREAKLNEQVISDREDLQPVDGVSLELWAKAMAYSANSGGDTDGTLAIMGKDQAGFDKVSQEWNTRMANDTTYTIMQVYSAAFTASSTAGKPEITKESFSFKKYVKVSKALELLTEQGKDAQEILAMFDMSVTDWSDVSEFWSKKQQANVEKYTPLYLKYEKKYAKKYAAGDSNSDIEF